MSKWKIEYTTLLSVPREITIEANNEEQAEELFNNMDLPDLTKDDLNTATLDECVVDDIEEVTDDE